MQNVETIAAIYKQWADYKIPEDRQARWNEERERQEKEDRDKIKPILPSGVGNTVDFYV